MPNRADCEDEIIAASGGLLSRAAARRLLDRVDARASRLKIDPMEAARQIGDEATAAAIVEKRNRLMNLRKRVGRTEAIGAKYEALKARYGNQSLTMALRSEVTGLNADVAGGKGDAVELLQAAAKQKYLGGIERKLRDLGVWDAFRTNREFQRDIGREIWEQSRASMGLPHQIGITKSKMAVDAAEAIHGFQSLAKSDLNSEGAWIGDYAGYIAAQNQDGGRVFKAGFPQWAADMMGWLDRERTFEGVDNPGQLLRDAWDNMFTGIHVGEGGGVGLKDPAFTGPGNLARQLSESRILHFKDADSWMAAMDKYGRGSLPDQILTGLRRSGDNYGLLKRFGTNPTAEFENDIRRTEEWYRHEDPLAAKHLREHKGALLTEMNYVNGALEHPVSEQWARIGQGLRNIESLAKLGFIPITHLFSMGTVISKVTHETDIPWYSAVANTIASIGRGSGDNFGRGQLHDELLAGLDGIRTGLASLWTVGGESGMTTQAVTNMLRWSGFHYIINAFKAGAKDMAARNLGMQIDRTFDELGANTQRSLRRYGISRSDWEILRSAPDHVEVEGRPYITPMAAFRADPDNELFTYAMRRDLAMKLYTYFEDQANEGVVTPGAREQAVMFQDNKPGTPIGELVRAFGQFKTWGAAAVRQNLGREWHGNDTRGLQSQIMSVAGMAALMTVLGYGRIATRAVLTGQVPPSPLHPTVWAQSLAQAGGFGIMGDFLDAAVSRSGQSIGETLLGPTMGTASQVVGLGLKARDAAIGRGSWKALGSEATQVALNNTPFINLWYLRMALNYAVIWRMQEAFNPGFQRRYEERMKKNGTQFFLSPAAAVGH